MQENLDAEAEQRIQSMLIDFESHVTHYRKTLNDEGMWLFLAVLGCWGVTEPGFRYVALVLTFLLFIYRLYSRLDDQRTFPRRMREMEEAIRSGLSYEGQLPMLDKLKKLAEEKLSNKSHITSAYVYMACHGYLVGSLVYFGYFAP